MRFLKTFCSGYSADGGVYFPERIPVVSDPEKWANMSYKELVTEVMELFISPDEIPKADLTDLVNRSFGRFRVPQKGQVDDVIAFHNLGSDVVIAELFHGPTMAFKDLALSVVGSLYEYFLRAKQEHKTIVVGTSGDTGSAAIEAVRGKKWLDIVVLLPKGRCTKIQELQMTTVLDSNVHTYCGNQVQYKPHRNMIVKRKPYTTVKTM